MSLSELIYNRPPLYAKQEAFVDCLARYTVVEASPKTGKTVSCILWIVEQAMQGKIGWNYWWVAPTLQQADIAFRRLQIWFKESGLPQAAYGIRLATKSVALGNGTIVWFKGADKPDSLYGEDVYAAVIDEATRCKEESWHAVRSTLTATGGRIKIIGNVRGRRNWAYKLARRAQAGEQGMAYFGLTAYDAVEGGIYSLAEIEDAERVLPAAVFRELYLLDASEDQGNPFGFDAIEKAYLDHYSRKITELFAGDLARGGKLNPLTKTGRGDWTVILGLDAAGHPTRMERWQANWTAIEDKIVEVVGTTQTVIDETGVGAPVTEHLQARGANVEGFVFSSTSKQQIMELLASSLRQGLICIVGVEAKNEFESFEYEYTRTGCRYSAPDGENDDIVCAYAMANWKARQMIPYSFSVGREREITSMVRHERVAKSDVMEMW